jgi:hypothetical protein
MANYKILIPSYLVAENTFSKMSETYSCSFTCITLNRRGEGKRIGSTISLPRFVC